MTGWPLQLEERAVLHRRVRVVRLVRLGLDVMGAQLLVAAVLVLVAVRPLVRLLVLDLGRFGSAGGAGDVGDRREVVPVDAVAQPERQRRQQQRNCSGVGFGHAGIIAARRDPHATGPRNLSR